MAFNYINSQGRRYTLHSKLTTLTTGELCRLYYFANAEREGVLDEVPPGYEVGEDRYGRPLLHLCSSSRGKTLTSARRLNGLFQSKRFFQ